MVPGSSVRSTFGRIPVALRPADFSFLSPKDPLYETLKAYQPQEDLPILTGTAWCKRDSFHVRMKEGRVVLSGVPDHVTCGKEGTILIEGPIAGTYFVDKSLYALYVLPGEQEREIRVHMAKKWYNMMIRGQCVYGKRFDVNNDELWIIPPLMVLPGFSDCGVEMWSNLPTPIF